MIDMSLDDPIAQLRQRIEELWQKTGLDCPPVLNTSPQHDGSRHVETFGDRYVLLTTERGNKLEHLSGLKRDDAAKILIHDELCLRETRSEALTRANAVRSGETKGSGYSRLNWMAPIVEKMGSISPEFGGWARARYADVLKSSPLTAEEVAHCRFPLTLNWAGRGDP